MRVKWTSGNNAGLVEDVATPTAQSAVTSGIAVYVTDENDTAGDGAIVAETMERAPVAERAVKRPRRAPSKKIAKKATTKKAATKKKKGKK